MSMSVASYPVDGRSVLEGIGRPPSSAAAANKWAGKRTGVLASGGQIILATLVLLATELVFDIGGVWMIAALRRGM